MPAQQGALVFKASKRLPKCDAAHPQAGSEHYLGWQCVAWPKIASLDAFDDGRPHFFRKWTA